MARAAPITPRPEPPDERSGPPQRAHRPDELGPRLFLRRGSYAADLRPWSDGTLPEGLADRPTLRSPRAAGWPFSGSYTRDAKEAREWSWAYVALYRDEVRRAEAGAGRTPVPIERATEAFLKHRKATVEHNTYSSSRTACGHLVEWLGRERTTAAVTAPRLQALFDDLVAEGYAISTLGTLRNHLSAFCQWLGYADGQPARGIKLPDRGEFVIEAWGDAALQAIRDSADRVDFARRGRVPSARLAVELALGAGLRQQELFALDWAGLDPAEQSCHVVRQLVKDGAGFKPLKGKRARRAFVLPGFWHWYREGARGLVLGNADGTPIGSQSRLQRDLIQRTLDGAQLNAPGVGWHSLRHAYARLCLEEYGVTIDELSLFLGHASPAVTLGVYGHYAPHRAIANVRQRLAERMAGRAALRAG